MKKPKSLLLLIIALSAFYCITFISAEIPPRYYQQDQNTAPEFLEIEVLDVTLDWYFWRKKRKVSVKAKVIEVHRSKTGLKPGQIITIRYLHSPLRKGMTGARPIPVLQVGITTPAWLKRFDVNYKDGIIFHTAAKGYSFQQARR